MSTQSRRIRAAAQVLVLIASTAIGLAVGQPQAGAAAPTYLPPPCPATGVSIVAGQPVEHGVLQVAKVAPRQAGGPEKWDLKWDPWICNKTSTTYRYVTVRAAFFTGRTLTKTVGPQVLFDTQTKDLPGYEYFKVFPSNAAQVGFFRPGEPIGKAPTLYSFPLPDKITFTITLKKTQTADTFRQLERTYSVAVQKTPGPVGAFLWPLSSLPENAYYAVGYHDDFNVHNRYALDIVASRWDPDTQEWSPYRARNGDPTDPANNHYRPESWVMWGQEVRAMSDGEVVACSRAEPDNNPYIVDGVDMNRFVVKVPQIAKFAGGNFVWIRTGNQTQVYAHLQQFSIPYALCPHSESGEFKVADPYSDPPSDAAYQVKAGEFLGYVGNSGSTSNPHTHVESIMGTSEVYMPPGENDSEFGFGADSRPMNFVNVLVEPDRTTAPSASEWTELTTPHALPYDTLILPNHCGLNPITYEGRHEVVQAGVPAACWSQTYNVMVQAGFRPVHYDSHPTGTSRRITTVWRPDDGTNWVLVHNMTASSLKDYEAKYRSAGYRYLDLQGYSVNGTARYGAIWVKQPGAAQSARAGMTLPQFSAEFATRTAAGDVMLSYSVAVVGGVRSYTGLWVHSPALSASHYLVKDVKVADYQTEFNTQTAAGLRPVSLDGYELNGVAYLATVWHDDPGDGWAAQHTMTIEEVGPAEDDNVLAHRLARTVTEYAGSSTHHFAASWLPAPDTAITAGPSGTTSLTLASFAFSAPNDPLASFECKLGTRSAYVPCKSPYVYTGLTPGTRTFFVRSVGFDGVRDATPATRIWTVTA